MYRHCAANASPVHFPRAVLFRAPAANVVLNISMSTSYGKGQDHRPWHTFPSFALTPLKRGFNPVPIPSKAPNKNHRLPHTPSHQHKSTYKPTGADLSGKRPLPSQARQSIHPSLHLSKTSYRNPPMPHVPCHSPQASHTRLVITKAARKLRSRKS